MSEDDGLGFFRGLYSAIKIYAIIAVAIILFQVARRVF